MRIIPTLVSTLVTLALAAGLAGPAGAVATVGAPAPDFAVADSSGEVRSLAEFKGKTVILEWTNHECPYVAKHYGSGNMQSLQKAFTEQGVVWLSVISSAPGTEGNVSPAKANELTKSRSAAPSAVLLDAEG